MGSTQGIIPHYAGKTKKEPVSVQPSAVSFQLSLHGERTLQKGMGML